MTHSTRKGFTLIEILVVVTIIGILASIALIGLGPSRRAAQDARRIADMRSVQNALEIYFNAEGKYPVKTAADISAAQSNYEIDLQTELRTVLGSSLDLPNDTVPIKQYGYESNGTVYLLGAVLDGKPPAGYNTPGTTGFTGMADYCASTSGGRNPYCVTL